MKGSYITHDEMLRIPALEISDMHQMAPSPLVSVIVITYNHEPYITQTVEGILAQQGDFPIELIIGEDKSQDGTLAICLDYQQRRPNLVRVVTWHENVGANANFLRVWGRARGKYVAVCEGDDYWIDPNKLAKQVGVMEQAPRMTLCGARTRMVSEIAGKNLPDEVIGPKKRKREYSFKDVVRTYFCHTSTFMFRKSALLFPPKVRSLEYLDRFLQCLSALQGSVGCLPDVVSVWRVHAGGIYSGNPVERQFYSFQAVFTALLEIVNEPEVRWVKRGFDITQSQLCHQLVNEGKISEARMLANGLLSRLAGHEFLQAMLLFLHVYLPAVYDFIMRQKKEARAFKCLGRFY